MGAYVGLVFLGKSKPEFMDFPMIMGLSCQFSNQSTESIESA